MARHTVLKDGEQGVYHCISRCVRRAYLCGEDPFTQKDYSHRKGWIRARLKELSEVFGMEVYAYAVMSNHLHVVLQTVPEVVASWANEEVVRRWCRLFPKERDAQGRALPVGEATIRTLCADEGKLKQMRERLGSLSWFMRCLNEPIARRANKEDDCKGRFWEGRFKCQRLEHEGAILACMAYVDLNPVRAGMSDCPEASEFTSVYDRIIARQAKERLKEAERVVSPTQAQKRELVSVQKMSEAAAWLKPFENKAAQGLFCQVDLDKYLELVDWTGRCMKGGKRGVIPNTLSPVLERLELDTEEWVENVQRFGSLFYRVAGKFERLGELAKASGQRWFRGRSGSEQLFALDSSEANC